jgi:hypothetical protein
LSLGALLDPITRAGPQSGDTTRRVIAYGEGVSRPAKIVAALMLVGGVALAIAGYFAAKGSDESYWAPLVPVFVLIYAAIALGLVVAVDAVIRSAMRWHRARFAKPS